MAQNERNLENAANAKSIEISGKTIDEAIEQGLAQLKLTQDDVTIEVIREGKRGVFGIGAEEALVRLTPKEIESTALINAESSAEEIVEAQVPAIAETAPPIAGQTPEEIAQEYLEGLLKRMGIRATVVLGEAEELVEPGEETPFVLDITGQDLGILIGRRSETLRALQYMLRLMVSKRLSRWYPIIIDVESYRVRRRHSLQQLAEKMAKKAVTSRRRVVLEAMPAYERRIVHLTLRDHPAVYTKSVGSEDNRKVTIIPK